MHEKRRILVVDDHIDICNMVAFDLRPLYDVETAASVRQALEIVESSAPDAVLTDVNMPERGGLELLAHLRESNANLPVIVMTGNCDKDTAMSALKGQAFDIFEKPLDFDALRASIARAVDESLRRERRERILGRMEKALSEIETQAKELDALGAASSHAPLQAPPRAFEAIVTADPVLLGRLQYASVNATTGMPIQISGETGTGKDLVAKAIHVASGVAGAFVAVNVAGLDDGMLSDTLFGHVAGAYTNADRPRRGLVEAAENGTLFLDEIGDLGAAAQIKLLRLLENQEYFPLGSDAPRRSRARIVAATHRNLEAGGEMPAFRRDLYFRLKAHHVRLPSLRERRGDLPLLLEHFVAEACRQLDKPRLSCPPAVVEMVRKLELAGNVRELRGIVFDAVGRCIGPTLALSHFVDASPRASDPVAVEAFPAVLPTLREAQDALLKEALRRADGNQTAAARLLGITRQALGKRLSRKSRKGV